MCPYDAPIEPTNREERRAASRQPSNRRTFVTMAEAAEHLGVHVRTVRRYISEGLFPAYRFPGKRGVRLDLAEVNARMRAIPTKRAHTGVGSFGPRATIIDMPRRVDAEPEA